MKTSNFQILNNSGWEFPYLQKVRDRSGQKPDFFQNKVVIVTGASSGIGRAIARKLAEKRVHVILASRNRVALDELMREINENGGSGMVIPTDVTDEMQCKALIERSINAFGKIDILVNNASISMRAAFSEVELNVLRKVMETNFWGSVYCTKYALPHLIRQKGSVVGISSICGITPLPGRTGYAASKHALDGFMDSLRIENLKNDLHVMLVHPGFTVSNIRNEALNYIGMPQIETPLEEDKLMPAEQVAKEVVSAIVERKSSLTLTREGKIITWM